MSRTVLTDTTIAPDLVPIEDYGYHKSFVNRAATIRTWTFETAEAAGKFSEAVKENPDQFRRGKNK